MSEPRLLTVYEVTQRLRRSRWTLRRMAKRGELVPVRLPNSRALRYRSFDVERWESRLRLAK